MIALMLLIKMHADSIFHEVIAMFPVRGSFVVTLNKLTL